VSQLKSIARSYNPSLALVPTVYFPQLTVSFATTYGPLDEPKSVGDNGIDASVDDVEATGFTLAGAGVESASRWTPGLARQGTTMYCSAQVYRQHYGEETGAAIAALYGMP
jgi:hypothetical protein